jgi:hypothetical protein
MLSVVQLRTKGDNMEHEKHNMVREDYPAVSSAKKVCKVVLVVLVILIIAGYSSPVVSQFLNANAYWIVVILGGIVVVSAIRAFEQSFSR